MQVAELKRVLDVKAKEMSATGMVMVHDLLVLTNDFLSEAEQAVNIANKKEPDACESLFQKMKTKEQHQKQLRVSTSAAKATEAINNKGYNIHPGMKRFQPLPHFRDGSIFL